MGCLDVKYTRIGSAVQAVFGRVGDFLASFSRSNSFSAEIVHCRSDFDCTFSREKAEMQTSFFIVCGTSIGQGYLCSCDARLLTYDGMTMSVIEI